MEQQEQKKGLSLPKTYFDLISKVGDAGKYQRNLFFILSFIYFVNGSVLIGGAFLFLNNQFRCEEMGLLTDNCQELVCQILSHEQRILYFKSNKEDVYSIATQFGPFFCENSYILDLLISLPYFGALFGNLLSSCVVDNFGRKKTMILWLIIAFIGSILICLSFNLVVIAIGVFLIGGGTTACVPILYYFLAEQVEYFKRQKYSVLVQSAYTLGAFATTGLYYISRYWLTVTWIIITIPLFFCILLVYFYIEDTPIFLLKKSKSQALKSLNRIGQINFKIKNILSERDIQNVKKQQQIQFNTKDENSIKNLSFIDLFRFQSLRTTTLISILFGSIIYSVYYGPALLISQIGFDTYVTSTAVEISQIICYIPCYYLIDKIKRKQSSFFLFLITVICSGIINFLQKPQNCDFCIESIFEVILIFVFRFAICAQFVLFNVFVIQLFPTKISGAGVSISNAAGGIASSILPLVLGIFDRMKIGKMLLFMILGTVGMCLSVLLKQTLGEPISTQIEELRNVKQASKSQIFQNQQQKNTTLDKIKQEITQII